MESQGMRRSTRSRWTVPGNFWRAMGILGALVWLGVILGARAEAAAPTVAGATYIGADKCQACHPDQVTKIQPTLHGKLLGTKLSETALQRRGCEACHGPGSKHLENPADPSFNIRFGKKSRLAAADQNSVCLQCHERGKRMLWAGSPHEARDVTCATCHSVHSPQSEKGQLRKATQPELCSQCHQVRDLQFQKSSHMPLREGKLTCTSCHNPHGTVTEKLIPEVSLNASCTRCHADKRGPFLWDHAPVIENCTNCHVPHGSNNPTLLKIKQPRLCQQCHIQSRHPSQPYGQGERRISRARLIHFSHV